MTRTFAVTWDYLCPFARNAHEHIVAGLQAGADWDVTFVPFSLRQTHIEEGEPSVWDRDDVEHVSGVLALMAGVAVRDHFPERFLQAHLSLFAARHDDGRDLRDEAVVGDALTRAGVDPAAVFERIRAGEPRETLAKEHQQVVEQHGVFGVPTFVIDHDAVFVRLMHRPDGDASLAVQTTERVLDLLTGWPQLNEFKHTRIPR